MPVELQPNVEAAGGKSRWTQAGVLAAMCSLVIGVYAYMAQSGVLELQRPNAADTYYNLLVQGFRAGQLSLKEEAPRGLTRLADPYDPAANIRYRSAPYLTHDMSYYKGRLYLYFGVTPALILFWPFVALTGHWLLHREAVAIFCSMGFLASVGLLYALWRRYFADVSIGVVAACALALGLATGVPVLLSQSDVYEVPISCGYMLMMLALGAIWCGLHEPERRGRWLAAASAAYGLAVGARPNLVFGGLILLVPVMAAWRERRRVWTLLMAATAPIMLIGLGLMLYNELRFGSPWEFGGHYQLAGQRQVSLQFFRLRYLWVNFRIYFLEPAHWSARTPFVLGGTVPRLPAGYTQVRRPFGVLTNVPLVWLALAVPLTWRNRSDQASSVLRWFVAAAALLFATCALTLECYCGSSFRYEVDFLPALVLLAVVGILGLERVRSNRPVWRRVARCGWGLLLGFSVAFNLLASVEYYSEAHYSRGFALAQLGKVPEAMGQYEQAVRLNPHYAEAHKTLGNMLLDQGRLPEALNHFEHALRTNPDSAEAHNNLAVVLVRLGKLPEAADHFEQALRINPDSAEAHNNLAVVLLRLRKVPEAAEHFDHALRINPDLAEAHSSLAVALEQQGKLPEAMQHLAQALRINPDDAETHYNLGRDLEQVGRVQEATAHYEQAVRLNPNYAEAQRTLGNMLLDQGRLTEAMDHFQQALRINPDSAEAHNNLAVVLVRLGKIPEAAEHFEHALRITPDLAEAHSSLAVAFMQMGKLPEAVEHFEQALRISPDDAETHYDLGRALEQAGRVQEAKGHYEQALRIKPDFPEAQKRLARLRTAQ